MTAARGGPRDRSLGLRLAGARLVLLWEQLWPRLWPALGVIGVFVLLALFDLPGRLPGWLHLLLLLGFALVLLREGRALLRGLSWPSRDAALARLERDSGLSHQPLRLLEDELAAGTDDPLSRRLWALQQERLRRLLSGLRLRPPRSLLPRIDPWALRAGLLLLLVVGYVEASGEVGRRLARALVPAFGTAEEMAAPPRAEVWITPPAYTDRPPLRIQAPPSEAVAVPVGSELRAQVQALAEGEATPRLEVGERSLVFTRIGPASAEVRLVPEQGGSVTVRRADGEPLLSFGLVLEPDRPPQVRFLGPPQVTLRRTLELRYEAEDDYGVAELALLIAPPEPSAEPGGSVERRTLLRLGAPERQLKGRNFLDLTAHPRAGLPVRLRLEAVDGRGQVAQSGVLELVLPERVFTHPLAREVIALRRQLVDRPERWAWVAFRLEALAGREEALLVSPAVPVALQLASSGLRHSRAPEERRYVVDLLWEVALFIEEGALALSERQLRELQEALRRMLREGADGEELARLMAELEQALSRYLDELARRSREALEQALREGRLNDPIPPDLDAQSVRREEILDMLERARQLLESGMREAAEQLLAELQRLLDNLQAGLPPPRPSPGEEALARLQGLIEEQQRLLDETFRMQRGGRGPRPQQPGADGREGAEARPSTPEGLAGAQEALRRALGALMRELAEAELALPRALGEAELRMRRARDALARGRPDRAVPPQGEALDLLRQGGQALLEQLREQLANQPGQASGFGMLPPPGSDPLGRARRNQGGWQTEGVEIPDDYDLGRAREVLEELYRRSGELGRPAYERDYYRRLLDRF